MVLGRMTSERKTVTPQYIQKVFLIKWGDTREMTSFQLVQSFSPGAFLQ